MSRSRVLWWILLIFWIAGSVYWHVIKIRHFFTDPVELQTAIDSIPAFSYFRISDGEKLQLTSPGNFSFAHSAEYPDISTVRYEMDSLASFLLAHPSNRVTITGSYYTEEVNKTFFRNLGLARAASVRSFFTQKGLADSIFTLRSRINPNPLAASDTIKGGIEIRLSHSPLNLSNP